MNMPVPLLLIRFVRRNGCLLLLAYLAWQPLAGQPSDASLPDAALVPALGGTSWKICHMPDLDSLQGPRLDKQHIVDHGFIRDRYGNWQLWACIRGTKVGRILYGWEGKALTRVPWEPRGVKARAQEVFGEKTQPEAMQAPYFLKIGDTYHCFYNSQGIRLMTSRDGLNYERAQFEDGSNLLYAKGGRDVMVLREGNTYYAYSTVTTVAKDGWLWGFIILRTSKDLRRWSDYTIVSQGGRAGNGAVSAESPFVLKYRGHFYLFRSSSITGTTFVYRSRDPYDFGVNRDDKLIAELPIKAPELIFDEGQWYISDLADFDGIVLHELNWEEAP